jgi:alanyl-tRNA synthetase
LRELKESKAEIEKLDQEIAHNLARELESQALYPKGYPVIIGLLDDVDKSLPLKILDLLKSRHSQYFIYLINKNEERLALLAACSRDLARQGLHCGKIIQATAKLCQGNGGGRPEMAQAGGKDISKVDEIIDYVKELFK